MLSSGVNVAWGLGWSLVQQVRVRTGLLCVCRPWCDGVGSPVLPGPREATSRLPGATCVQRFFLFLTLATTTSGQRMRSSRHRLQGCFVCGTAKKSGPVARGSLDNVGPSQESWPAQNVDSCVCLNMLVA